MLANAPSLLQIPHLLEWHAWHCAAQATTCKELRAERLLRALSVDLALEAERYRRTVRRMTQIGRTRSEPAAGDALPLRPEDSPQRAAVT